MRIYVGNLIIQKLYLVKPEKIIAMVQSDHRNDSLIHSHIAVLRFVFFPLAHRNVFSIHSRMASEADLLKLNTLGFELMRLLCFVDVGK